MITPTNAATVRTTISVAIQVLDQNTNYFKHLYTCKIDPDKQDLLEIKSRSYRESETLPTLGGDKAEKAQGDPGTQPKPLDCTCK